MTTLLYRRQLHEYCALTKPGIIMGNSLTAAAGFAMASHHHFNIALFIATLCGLACIIASACICNNYSDRCSDAKMTRTKYRPLVVGTIPTKQALIFASILGVLGTCVLSFFTNFLTTTLAITGFFLYVYVYTKWKYLSEYGTHIGSISGAIPPVVGYCAVSNSFDAGAWLLFFIVMLWQMPHFFAIAVYRLKDYKAASIPVMPAVRGVAATKKQIACYIALFTTVCTLPTLFHYTGYVYVIVMTLLNIAWLAISIQKASNDTLWARKIFIFSLVIIMALCGLLSFDAT